MEEAIIKLNKINDMSFLIKTYPNISDDELLKGGCYILKMKDDTVVCFDCRICYRYKSPKLRGSGFEINAKRTHNNSKVATRHIIRINSGIHYNYIQKLYPIEIDDFELFNTTVSSYQKNFHEIIKGFEIIKGIATENRYFCSPSLDVIVKIKPNGYELNPTWCKASAVYDAVEELSLISPHSTGFSWWYYPGRMYFSATEWFEISMTDYNIAKQYILDKEKEIFNMINNMANNILI